MMAFTQKITILYLSSWFSMLIFSLFFYKIHGVFIHFILPTIRSAGIFFAFLLFYMHVLKRERRLIKFYRHLLRFRSFQLFLLLFPVATFASLGWDVTGTGHSGTSQAFLRIFGVILSVLLNEYLIMRRSMPGFSRISSYTPPAP